MKKEFYSGQPLIIKRTGERVIFVYNDGDSEESCNVLENNGYFYRHYEASLFFISICLLFSSFVIF